jgi:hypothetical protein
MHFTNELHKTTSEIWQLYYYQTIVIYWYNIVKLYIDTRITTLLRTRTHVDKLTI